MSKQQKKLEKRRNQEKATKQKLRVRRDAKHKEEKEVRIEAKEAEDHKKMVNERLRLERWIKAAEGKIPEELGERIRHNIEILKSLEAEHAAELKARQEARDIAAREQRGKEKKVNNDPHIGEAWAKACSEGFHFSGIDSNLESIPEEDLDLEEKISLDAKVS